MPKIDPPRALTPKEVHEIGEAMTEFADRYKSLSAKMSEKGVPRLPVKNLKTLKRALGYITTALNRAQAAYDDALLVMGVFSDPPKESGITPAYERERQKVAGQPKKNAGKKKV